MVPPIHHACRSTIVPVEGAVERLPPPAPIVPPAGVAAPKAPKVPKEPKAPKAPKTIDLLPEVATPAGVAAPKAPKTPKAPKVPKAPKTIDLLPKVPKTPPATTAAPAAERTPAEYAQARDAWKARLTPQQRKAIWHWTGGGYRSMRIADAAGKSNASLKLVYQAMSTAPRFTASPLMRGIKIPKGAAAKAFQEGDLLAHNALASWSTEERIANRFADWGRSPGVDAVRFEIARPTTSLGAVQINDLSQYAREFEVLVPRDARLRIARVIHGVQLQDGGKITRVILEVVEE